jgi:Heterokaryon incompatibility protein (HET)
VLSSAVSIAWVGLLFKYRQTHLRAGIFVTLISLSAKFAYDIFTTSRIYFCNPSMDPLPDNPSPHGIGPLARNNVDGLTDESGTYKHTPLSHKEGIRLLLLKSGTDDVLECELIEFSIDTIASYEALSYTWGPPNPQKYIVCHGKKLPITENCEAALRHLRLPLAGRLLWVDSICIDQFNIIEKNQQLRLMGNIYSRAKDVLIWLGLGTLESDIAFRYMTLYTQLRILPETLRDFLKELIRNKIIRKFSPSIFGCQ